MSEAQPGDLLDVQEGIIVHGCNAQGVMGSGVAKLIREKYPEAFAAYRKAFEEKGLTPGQVVWARVQNDPLLVVANAITQKYYGRNPKTVYVDYGALELCFRKIGHIAREKNMPVHYPAIGAGLGGGDWSRIQSIINKELQEVAHTLWIPKNLPSPSPSL